MINEATVLVGSPEGIRVSQFSPAGAPEQEQEGLIAYHRRAIAY
jgi:hypothetical protein